MSRAIERPIERRCRMAQRLHQTNRNYLMVAVVAVKKMDLTLKSP
jgi:hypothetical protein